MGAGSNKGVIVESATTMELARSENRNATHDAAKAAKVELAKFYNGAMYWQWLREYKNVVLSYALEEKSIGSEEDPTRLGVPNEVIILFEEQNRRVVVFTCDKATNRTVQSYITEPNVDGSAFAGMIVFFEGDNRSQGYSRAKRDAKQFKETVGGYIKHNEFQLDDDRQFALVPSEGLPKKSTIEGVADLSSVKPVPGGTVYGNLIILEFLREWDNLPRAESTPIRGYTEFTVIRTILSEGKMTKAHKTESVNEFWSTARIEEWAKENGVEVAYTNERDQLRNRVPERKYSFEYI